MISKILLENLAWIALEVLHGSFVSRNSSSISFRYLTDNSSRKSEIPSGFVPGVHSWIPYEIPQDTYSEISPGKMSSQILLGLLL